WWEPYSEAELDQTLAYARAQAGATVLRFWAFQSYTRGGTDWSGIDRVLRLAKKHGMRVIPVLENNQPHCSQGGPKYENNGSWYANAPRRDFTYGHPLSLPDYIDRIVARYKDEPAIFAWMVMNEAESDNREALFQFAKATTEQVKRLDPNHLVTLGAQSNGVAGVSGADFLRVFALASIDFAEGHDWGYWASEEEALPGSPDGQHLPDPRSAQCLSTAYIPNHPKIACSIAQSLQVLGKPYLMGESGLVADSAETRARRASRLDAKMNAFFLNGGAGYLYWQLNKLVDSEKFDVLTTTNDPLFAVMKKYATGTASASPP
ncbi:MAG TPA: cellulase family glycosylhydrolase, partial [Cystobacter sp.]